jgi:hypothetical protein
VLPIFQTYVSIWRFWRLFPPYQWFDCGQRLKSTWHTALRYQAARWGRQVFGVRSPFAQIYSTENSEEPHFPTICNLIASFCRLRVFANNLDRPRLAHPVQYQRIARHKPSWHESCNERFCRRETCRLNKMNKQSPLIFKALILEQKNIRRNRFLCRCGGISPLLPGKIGGRAVRGWINHSADRERIKK